MNVGFGQRVRFRSVASVLNEVEECINKYNIDHFIIQDDTFNLKPKRLTALLEGFIDLGVKSWSCDARVDLMTKDMLAQMVKAGCKKISFGVESGSPRILELNKKGINLEQVRNAVKWSREVGLDCVETTFMIGSHPDETIEDVMQTQKLMKELSPDIVFLSVLVPYPGTEVFSIMKDRGFIFANDWDDFVMFGSIPKWRTTNFGPEALVEIQQKILKNYYVRPSYIFTRLLKLRNRHEIIYWIQSGLGFLKYSLSQLWRHS